LKNDALNTTPTQNVENRTESAPRRLQVGQKDFMDLKNYMSQLINNTKTVSEELKSISSATGQINKLQAEILEHERQNSAKWDELSFNIKSIAGSFKTLFDLEKNRSEQANENHAELIALLIKKK
jgi:hypothetical protein